MATLDQAELVTIGRIERSFGVRGEARVRSLTDVPGRFESLGQVTIVGPVGKTLDTRVTHVRPGGPTWIMGFEAFTTLSRSPSFVEPSFKFPAETRRRCRPINTINVI